MRFKAICASLAVAAAALAEPASAATNFTSNFDGLTFSGDSTIVETIDDWQSVTHGIRVRTGSAFGTAFPTSAPNFIELDTVENSSMSRMIEAGAYTLTYLYSPRPGNPEDSNGIELFLGNNFADGLTADGVDLEDTDWSQISLSFTVYAPTLLTFAASGASDMAGGYLDNIDLVGTALPVPEPGEWAMMIAGLGVIGAVARRRRSA